MANSRSSTEQSQNSDDEVSNQNSYVNSQLKDIDKSLSASNEIVKALYHIMSEEGEQSSRLALVSALRIELDRAKVQVSQLVQEEWYDADQVDVVLKRFSEEIEEWKRKGKQKIKKAVSGLAKEVEIERKMRRRIERMNIKLGSELADMRTRLEKALVAEAEKEPEMKLLKINEGDAGKEKNEAASQYCNGMDDESSDSELLSIELNMDDSTKVSEEKHWENVDSPAMSFGKMSSLREACSALLMDIESKRKMSEMQ